MINECDPTIASWSNNGEFIEIKDSLQFESQIMPIFFESEKFSSFNRQLNFYGFRKMPAPEVQKKAHEMSTKKMLRFYHKFFQKNKPELMANITRSTNRNYTSRDDFDEEMERLKDKLYQTKEKLKTLKNECNLELAKIEKSTVEHIEEIKKSLKDDLDNHDDT